MSEKPPDLAAENSTPEEKPPRLPQFSGKPHCEEISSIPVMRKRNNSLVVFAVIASCLLLLSVLANVIFLAVCCTNFAKDVTSSLTKSKSSSRTPFSETILTEGSDAHRIAVIEIHGLISYEVAGIGHTNMVDEIIQKLHLAAKDYTVKAVILDIDSPGGEVNASDVLYHEIKKVRDEANKPVVALFRSIAASGAYYVAMGSTYIVANRMTVTGSIGVILQTLQYKDLFQKVGLKTYTFKSGKFKDLLSPTREPTPEEIEYVQGFVMQTYDVFASIVEQERKFDNKEQFRSQIADGRIFSGQDALRFNLVDQLGYFTDAQNKAAELAGIKDAQVFRYEPSPSLIRLLRMLSRQFSYKHFLDFGGIDFVQWRQIVPAKAYYLSSTIFAP